VAVEGQDLPAKPVRALVEMDAPAQNVDRGRFDTHDLTNSPIWKHDTQAGSRRVDPCVEPKLDSNLGPRNHCVRGRSRLEKECVPKGC